MGEKTILDFKRVDVLPTFDDKIFDTTSDFDIAFRIYGCFITGLSHSSQQLWSSKIPEVTMNTADGKEKVKIISTYMHPYSPL